VIPPSAVPTIRAKALIVTLIPRIPGDRAGYVYQSLSFEVDHRAAWDLRRRTEIIPAKDPHTRIKPLALASGHGRYITVTPERTLVSVGEWSLHIAVINL
jgi:hypothetical protein